MIDLKNVIETYPESMETPEKFCNFLRDLYPNSADQARIKVLSSVIACGVSEEIKEGKTDSLDIARYRKLIEDKYGYSARLVAESVGKWVQAYAPGASVTATQSAKPIQKPATFENGKIHVHSFTDTVVKATCREHGYTLHKCDCGYEIKNQFTPIGDHHFEVVDEVAPTCQVAGRRDYLCSYCQEYKAEVIPKADHRLGPWKTVVEAGCETKGRQERSCATCAKTETKELPVLGHKWSPWVDSTFATCTENGKQMRQCSNCNKIEEKTVPATGHRFSEWVPSATQEGMFERFCENCGTTEYETASKIIEVGSTIKFGRYPQNADGKDKTPIEWRILAKKGNKALIISEKALDCQRYNTSLVSVTWETCSLRKWMNGTFLNNAFSTDELAQIQSTGVSTDRNPKYSTNPGKATTDKVFLLSINEVEKYFSSDEDRKCVPTAYVIAQGAYTISQYTKGGAATCWWWLRSPGENQFYAACVYLDGSVSYLGHPVNPARGCVRPALWINLDGINLDNYCDSIDKTQPKPAPGPTLKSEAGIDAGNIKVGGTIKFGRYAQNADGKDKTPIEWRVLAKEGNKALIISEKALDCQPYNTSFSDVTWKTCSLRNWLNGTFFNNAFSAEEQAQIQSTTVSADKNPEYSTSPGNATTDKVFLLSITEAKLYFSSDEDGKCVPTAYAIAQGAGTSDYDTKGGAATCTWWLRSPGHYQRDAALIYGFGSVYYNGYTVDYDNACVRPALWINLDS